MSTDAPGNVIDEAPRPFEALPMLRPPLAIDARATDRRGIGRYARELVTALATTPGCPSFLVLARPLISASEFGIPPAARREVDVVPFRPREGRLIRAELEFLHPALFHALHVNMPDLRNFPAKLVVTVHDLVPLQSPDFGAVKRLVFRRSLERSAFQADVMLVPGLATADALMAQIPAMARHIEIVPYGVPRVFAESPPNLDLRPDGPILALASSGWHKNLDALLRAHALSPEQVGEVHLVGPRSRSVTRRLRKDGRFTVRELGPLSDTDWRHALDTAFAFVFPARLDGVGRPILEAMARGCPVIVGTAPGCLETAGDAALAVDPDNPGSLVAALNRLRHDATLYAELQRRGVARAAEFSWATAAARTVEIYRSLLA